MGLLVQYSSLYPTYNNRTIVIVKKNKKNGYARY